MNIISIFENLNIEIFCTIGVFFPTWKIMIPFSFISNSIIPIENEVQSWLGSEINLESFIPLVLGLRQLPIIDIEK